MFPGVLVVDDPSIFSCIILVLFSYIYKSGQKICCRLKFEKTKFQERASMKQFRYNIMLKKVTQKILHDHNPPHASDT